MIKKSLSTEEHKWSWLHGLVWLGVLLLISADLKVAIYPHIHWIVFSVVFIASVPLLFTARFVVVPPAYAAFAVFTCSVFFNGLTASLNPGYDLIQGVKLAVLMGGLFFFVGFPGFAEAGFQAFQFSVWLNAALILAGMLGFTAAAAEMSPGRWGTFLNYPGSLWKAGITVFIYSAYLSSVSSRPYKYALTLGVSLAVIYFDGSRTAFIFLPLGAFYMLLILKTNKTKKIIFVLETALLLIVVFLLQDESFSSGIIQTLLPGMKRSSDFISRLYNDGITTGLLSADSVRFEMLQSALNAIQRHPGIGTGINSTTAETLIGPMVVHNVYLQVWSDLGPLGFLSYIWIALGWLPWLPQTMKKIESLPGEKEKALYYNAVFCLGVFAISGLFHPLSSEWSEWIIYIIPSALYWGLLSKPERGRVHG